MPLNVVDILHNCPLFSEVPAAGFQRLAAIARLCHFRKGQVVFRENEPCPGVLTSLTVWVRHLVTLMEDVTLRDAAGRLARFLLESPRAADGTIKLPGLKRHVASHLNLTSETFSRTLRRLVEAGLIAEADNARLRLLQPKKLRQVVEGLFPKL